MSPIATILIENCFPKDVADELARLPFAAAGAGRSLRQTRIAQRPAQLFRRRRHGALSGHAGGRRSASIEADRQAHPRTFGAPIDDTFLRLEYAQDIDGFWLQPHTDLGVKKFTCLIYLSEGPGHEKLGTDIYSSPDAISAPRRSSGAAR